MSQKSVSEIKMTPRRGGSRLEIQQGYGFGDGNDPFLLLLFEHLLVCDFWMSGEGISIRF